MDQFSIKWDKSETFTDYVWFVKSPIFVPFGTILIQCLHSDENAAFVYVLLQLQLQLLCVLVDRCIQNTISYSHKVTD